MIKYAFYQLKQMEDSWKQILVFLQSADKNENKFKIKKNVNFRKFAKAS